MYTFNIINTTQTSFRTNYCKLHFYIRYRHCNSKDFLVLGTSVSHLHYSQDKDVINSIHWNSFSKFERLRIKGPDINNMKSKRQYLNKSQL